jgi:hypothetical protein
MGTLIEKTFTLTARVRVWVNEIDEEAVKSYRASAVPQRVGETMHEVDGTTHNATAQDVAKTDGWVAEDVALARRLLAAVIDDEALVARLLKDRAVFDFSLIDAEDLLGGQVPDDEELLAPVIATLPAEDQATLDEAQAGGYFSMKLHLYSDAFSGGVVKVSITED